MRPFGRIFMLFCLPDIAAEVSAMVLRISSESASSDTARQPYGLAEPALWPQDRPRPCRALVVAQAGGEDVRASLAQWPSRIRISYLSASVICPKW